MALKVKINVNPASRTIKRLGLSRDGHVQRFFTAEVLRRIQRYMPYKTGATIKLMVIQTDIDKPEIVLDVPYGRYLYYGKKMVDAKTGKGPFPTADGPRYHRGTILAPTDEPLEYTKTKNPLAGPFWDRRLVAAEREQMSATVRRYIKRRYGT